KARGIKRLDELNADALVAFRAYLVGLPKRRPKSGGGRGAQAETRELRSAYSANREIRGVKTILRHLRSAGLTPRITGDDLRESFGLITTGSDLIAFLRPAEIAATLDACLAHDAETFKITRAENAGLRPVGTTPKNPEIGPFALVAFLT